MPNKLPPLGKPAIYIIAAAVSFVMVVPWFAAYCASRWRQSKRERNFGNTLQEEVRCNLSRVDFEISRTRHWGTAMLEIAPIMVGGMLLNWSIVGSQRDGTDDYFGGWWMYLIVAFCMVYLVRFACRYAKEKLEPRQRHLRELLATLDARE